eukprot:RCo045274
MGGIGVHHGQLLVAHFGIQNLGLLVRHRVERVQGLSLEPRQFCRVMLAAEGLSDGQLGLLLALPGSVFRFLDHCRGLGSVLESQVERKVTDVAGLGPEGSGPVLRHLLQRGQVCRVLVEMSLELLALQQLLGQRPGAGLLEHLRCTRGGDHGAHSDGQPQEVRGLYRVRPQLIALRSLVLLDDLNRLFVGIFHEEGESVALLPSSPCATNAVKVDPRVRWRVKVDHPRNIGEVQSSVDAVLSLFELPGQDLLCAAHKARLRWGPSGIVLAALLRVVSVPVLPPDPLPGPILTGPRKRHDLLTFLRGWAVFTLLRLPGCLVVQLQRTIGDDQDVFRARVELSHSVIPAALGKLRIEHRALDLEGVQKHVQMEGPVDGVHEDDHLPGDLLGAHHPVQAQKLLVDPLALNVILLHQQGLVRVPLKLNCDRGIHQPLPELHQGVGEGGGHHEHLAGQRDVRADGRNVLGLAQNHIRLVNDEKPQSRQRDSAPRNVLPQHVGGGHQDVRLGSQQGKAVGVALDVQGQHRDDLREVGQKGLQLPLHLPAQVVGGHHDNRRNGRHPGQLLRSNDVLDDWYRIGRRFPSARVCPGQDVLAAQGDRDDSSLDAHGTLPLQLRDGLQQPRVQVVVREGLAGTRGLVRRPRRGLGGAGGRDQSHLPCFVTSLRHPSAGLQRSSVRTKKKHHTKK